MSCRSQPPHSIDDETMSPIELAASRARQSIAAHAALVLYDRDRAVFFDTLINPRGQNDRLKAAFAEHARRVER
ncbi:hypothetical protein SQ03_07135 [Methylobacterium platani JCM 14648]|uniref:DUF1778 domain-containing protein n=3 Tax=Methylobacterium platani TaxID=427683 RepID=A0A179S8R4_9HYPH|nr:hypothetical protein SQ03_07135 [Methylobacterium platani JCM 14648]OAS24133.1 hypothetical protein A5481_15335 [Methylobacterium platani]